MKRINVALAIILFLAIAPESRGQKQTGGNDFINQGSGEVAIYSIMTDSI